MYVRILKYISQCSAVSHHGELYSMFVIAFTACLMSYSGLLCGVLRQVEHWCWCNSAMYSVSVCFLNVDQLRSSFVCDIVQCCWVFGIWHFNTACQYHSPTNITRFGFWHFDTACWYHSPTNVTLYSWTGKILCYFLHDSFSFSQNHCFIILYTYLLVIIHSTCSADIM